jgi:hypothetical protein
MALEQFRHQLGGGMLMEIRRQIGQANAVMPIGLPAYKGGWRGATWWT